MGHGLSFDLVIVGAGIIGLATARAIRRAAPLLSLCVIEKEDGVARHQTGRNSGVLHTGTYYKPGSERARNCVRGRAQMVAFCEEESIPHEICGKVIVAARESELSSLGELARRARENGVQATRIDHQALKELEPEAHGIEALHVPEAGIVDFKQVAARLHERLVESKVEFLLGSEVVGLSQHGRDVSVETTAGRVTCRFVINCGGLQSDRLARLGGANHDVQIVPFRGEYFELTQVARGLVRNLVYPVPRLGFPFLGVHFTRGIDGRVECGPNAVVNGGREAYDRGTVHVADLAETLTYPGFLRLAFQHYQVAASEFIRSLSKRAFLESAQALIPKVREEHLIRAPAGIRAQAISRDGGIIDDFVIEESPYVLSVLNAPSPAATAALTIGENIAARTEMALRDRIVFC